MKTVRLLLEKGADVNGQDNRGITPVYIAALEDNIDLVYFLLYYGANPNIASKQGLLPVNMVASGTPTKNLLVEILCLYSFDDHCTISLSVVAAAMWKENSPLFSVIVERLPKIVCDDDGIDCFCEYFRDVKAKHFKVFVDKFGDALQLVITKVDLLHVVVDAFKGSHPEEANEIFNYFLESHYVEQLVQNSDLGHSIIADYIQNFALAHQEKEQVHKRIFLMLSLGLNVTLQDLDVVFRSYGLCDLYKTMLHLDVVPTPESDISSMVRLHYHPDLDVEECYGSRDFVQLLDYFNSPELKCKASERSREMPVLRSLVEVSRNAAKKFILKRFNVRSAKQFLWVLNGLPIDRVTRSILALQQKIY